ncbi:HNH endonuclease [Paenibacillus sp. BK033]|uniref:HNH endonuclease n=1 Tax=Paenibacillus sp. BK033 TaxID=2512133 RepID=UPI001046B852|nr:HNH endonuclease [Paenibacillus sp. BK033]TCN00850.1 HNH endonuclease [Paenibacillus sp. BK033]
MKIVKAFYKTTRWLKKRERILRRDEYLCQECKRFGKSTTAQTVHHIHPLEDHPEYGYENWNLISLCNPCHGSMHDRTTDELTEIGKRWKERASPPLVENSN